MSWIIDPRVGLITCVVADDPVTGKPSTKLVMLRARRKQHLENLRRLCPMLAGAEITAVRGLPTLKPKQAGFRYLAHFRRSGHARQALQGGGDRQQAGQADIELDRGSTLAAVFKLLGITDATYFRWRKGYGVDVRHDYCDDVLGFLRSATSKGRFLTDESA